MLANCYVSIHTRPHPSSDTRRRIEVGGLCFPVNGEVAKKDDEADALLSNPSTPLKEKVSDQQGNLMKVKHL